MKHWKLAVVWVSLQVVFFGAWAALEESHFSSGHSILVKTVPVDPRDILRGQYLRLGYDIGQRGEIKGYSGKRAWVVLEPKGEFYTSVRVLESPPSDLSPDQVMIQGRLAWNGIEFGVEKYFVPEGTQTPDPKEITVRLRVNDAGRARIETVYVKGEPWPARNRPQK